MTAIADAARRVHAYIHQRKLTKSDEPEIIHSYHVGSAREASLNVSDLEILIAAATRVDRALHQLEDGVLSRDKSIALILKGEL